MSRKTRGDSSNVAELFIESAKYILGENKKFPKLAGDPAQVEATRRAIETSRALYEALNDDRTTAPRAIELAEQKKAAAENFRKVTGADWKL
jgi:hypothetical protein